MQTTDSRLDLILEAIAALPLEEQEMLIAIAKKRHIEKRREQIRREGQETLRAYTKGLAKEGTVAEMLKDLESD